VVKLTRKEKNKNKKKLKRKDNYAHDVVYPINPIVKRKMTGRRFLKELLIKIADRL
jgi:hypothetical protein